jgi:hypothetical protein
MQYIKDNIWELQILKESFEKTQTKEELIADIHDRIIKFAKIYMNLLDRHACNKIGGKKHTCTLTGGENCIKCIQPDFIL